MMIAEKPLDPAPFMADGLAYLQTARRGHANRKGLFTPSILYNLMAMSIEKLMMAALMHHGTLADNHTFVDLVDSMARVATLPSGLADELLGFQSYQEICSPFDGYSRKDLPPSEVERMLAMTERLAEWAALECRAA